MDLTRPLLALALAAPSLLLAAPAHAACDVNVQNPYDPTNKTVAAGTVVTWCWNNAFHSVTADNGSFDSGEKSTGTFQRTITATTTYHCTVHSSMHGTITVGQATTSPSPTKTTTSPTPAKTTPPPTKSPTPSRTPNPTPTSVSVSPTTTPPPATTAPPTTAAPTTAAPTTVAPTTVTPTPLAPLDPPQAKPKTGVAIAIGSLVAVGALGGAVWLFLRGRAV